MKPKRDDSIRIKLTETEKEWLEQYCLENGQTMSEVVRGLLRTLRQNYQLKKSVVIKEEQNIEER